MKLFKKLKKQPILYKKEQLILLISICCFIILGITFPVVQDTSSAKVDIGTDLSNDSKHFPLATPSKDNVEVSNDDSDETTTLSEEIPNDEVSDAKTSEAETDSSSKDDTLKDSNTSQDIDEKKKKKNSKKNNTSTDSKSDQETTTSKMDKPLKEEKVWVPPVYKTVHHDAVYETVTVYICNFCKATFDSNSGFLAHKEANGG